MKKMILALLTILGSSQAFATDPVVVRFVGAINETIQKANIELALEEKPLFCKELSPEQIAHIESFIVSPPANLPGFGPHRDLQYVAVDDFSMAVADQLMCYPLACENQRRASLVGVVCNSSAYRKDLRLLLDAFSAYAGRPVNSRASVGAVLGTTNFSR